jgi:hypothetical protein
MTDWDRNLVELITSVTDGAPWELKNLVEGRGTTAVSRVIADGFAEVFQASDEELQLLQRAPAPERLTREWRYLTTDEALRIVALDPVPDDYRIERARGALSLEDAPDLVFRYAADEPDAITEVRAGNGVT